MRGLISRFAEVKIVEAPKMNRSLVGAFRFLRSFPRVHAAVKASGCDLVYVNTLMFPQAYLAGFLNRIPVVVHLREVETTYGRFAYFFYYLAARICARHLIAVCDYIFLQKTALFISRIFPGRRQSVVHNWASDAPAMVPKAIRGKAKILSVIPVSRRKGIFDLIEFAALLRGLQPQVPFTLHVVGRTSDARMFEEAIRQVRALDLEGIVIFHGELGSDALAQFYSRADILVHPSHTEAFPRVIVEAMGHSLPCVATAVGGTPEAVENGRNGYLVPVGKPDEMARRVLDILTHEETCRAFSQEADRIYQRKFGKAGLIRKIVAIMEGECDACRNQN